jgi:hypothetical protein
VIEVATHPADLTTWNAEQQPFYLEVFGETRPQLNINCAEVLPAGALDAPAQTENGTLTYEYWWTIGHPGHAHAHSPLNRFQNFFGGDQDYGHKLKDPAARVYFCFPTDGGWPEREENPPVRPHCLLLAL